MRPQQYDICVEPRSEAYRTLIAQLEGACSTFGLVLQEQLQFDDRARTLLRELDPFSVSDELVASWPGTEFFRGRARLVRYRIESESMRSLHSTDRLFGWRSPALPEDLCAWRADGSLWMGTIAHEAQGWLLITPAEYQALSRVVSLSPTKT